MRIRHYDVIEILHKSDKTTVYKAFDNQTGKVCAIKTPSTEYPNQEVIDRFKNEYEYLMRLNGNGAPMVHAFFEDSGTVYLVMSYVGKPLMEKIGQISMGQSVHLFAEAARALKTIHQAGVIHKDINPSNLLVHEEGIMIIDYDVACLENRCDTPEFPEGTFQYISPEQTGKVEYSIDARSDHYGLGATFYHVLTGRAPFAGIDDLAALIHLHIAKMPVSPWEVKSQVPKVLSDIIMKLMEKNPLDRYQTMDGLIYDLERASSISGHDRITLGSHDGYRSFRLHQRLYGRDSELNQLMEWCLGRKRKTIIHVYGNEKVGKSIILEGLQSKLEFDDLYFARTHAVENTQRQSYRMCSQLVNSLVEQILYLDDDALDEWRAVIDEGIGRNTRLLMELSPLMKALIGDNPELNLMGAEEGKKRLNRAIADFIKLFTKGKNRLVLCIEDIQFMDPTFMELLESIMLGQDIERLTVILTSSKLESLQKSCGLLLKRCSIEYVRHQLEIRNISYQMIEKVLEDYRLVSVDGGGLAGFFHQRTKGNPYHMNLLIQLAIDHGHLKYEESKGYFLLDTDALEKEDLGIDAERLVADGVKQLEDDQKAVLAMMAHLGYECDIQTLEAASGLSDQKLHKYLIRFTGIQLIRIDTDQTTGKAEKYTFFSRYVHSLALSLFIGDIALFHYDIAMKMINTQGGDIQSIQGPILLKLTDHLHKAGDAVKPENRVMVSVLEKKAGDFSRIHGDFEDAFSHYRRAYELDSKPDLPFYDKILEMAFLTNRNDEFEVWHGRWMMDFNDESERLKAHLLKVKLLISSGNKVAAIEFVLEVLTRHGIRIKRNPTKPDVLLAFLKIKSKLGKQPVVTLNGLPEMQSEKDLILLEIMSIITSTAYLIDAGLYVLIVLKQMEWVCNRGRSATAYNTYALYALVLCAVFKDYTTANAIGRLARSRIDASTDKRMEARIYLHLGLFVLHFEEPLHAVRDLVDHVYGSGIQSGDYEYAAWGQYISALYGFYHGERLDLCIQKFDEAFIKIGSIGQTTQQQFSGIFSKQLKNIISPDPREEMVASDIEALMDMAKNHESPDSSLFYSYLLHFMTFYLAGAHRAAANISHEIEKRLDHVASTMSVNIHLFYDCLNKFKLTGFGQRPTQRRQREYQHNLSQMEKWALTCPENYRGKYLIAKACYNAMTGQHPEFLTDLHEGIEWSSRFGFIQEEAIGKELLMEYHAHINQPIAAKEHGRKAMELFEQWGCRFKVNLLNKRLNLLSDALKNSYQRSKDHQTEIGTIRHSMELETIIKSTQALSTEINEDRLVETFMKVIAEHAGADKVILFTTDNGSLMKRAMWNINDNPLEDAYPVKIVNYVNRAKVEVSFSLRDEKTGLGKDPYIELVQPQSILCVPMFYQNILKGILYLENKVTPNAFRRTKGSIIEVTLSQLVISLENSRLVSRLETVLEERTKALVEMSDNYKQLSITDQLTGLSNRRELERQIRHEFERARRYGSGFSIILLDIDHFKAINDKYGHYTGDSVLMEIGSVLKYHSREADIPGRWGGEEFLILCPETSYEKAVEFAEIIRQRIEKMESIEAEFVTASLGVATFMIDDDLADRIVHRADEAMYRAKMDGRNIVR